MQVGEGDPGFGLGEVGLAVPAFADFSASLAATGAGVTASTVTRGGVKWGVANIGASGCGQEAESALTSLTKVFANALGPPRAVVIGILTGGIRREESADIGRVRVLNGVLKTGSGFWVVDLEAGGRASAEDRIRAAVSKGLGFVGLHGFRRVSEEGGEGGSWQDGRGGGGTEVANMAFCFSRTMRDVTFMPRCLQVAMRSILRSRVTWSACLCFSACFIAATCWSMMWVFVTLVAARTARWSRMA